MCLYTLIDAIKIVFNGGNSIEFGLAIVYSIISVVGCGLITLYMKKKEKNLSSELIKAECNQWF